MDVLFTNMGKLECSKPFNNLLQNSGEVETHLTNAKPSNAFHIFDIYQTAADWMSAHVTSSTSFLAVYYSLFAQAFSSAFFVYLWKDIVALELSKGKMTRVFTERPCIRITTRLHQRLYNWVCAAFARIAFKPRLLKHVMRKRKTAWYHLHAEIMSSMKGKQHL